jgi:hypothetical protein
MSDGIQRKASLLAKELIAAAIFPHIQPMRELTASSLIS